MYHEKEDEEKKEKNAEGHPGRTWTREVGDLAIVGDRGFHTEPWTGKSDERERQNERRKETGKERPREKERTARSGPARSLALEDAEDEGGAKMEEEENGRHGSLLSPGERMRALSRARAEESRG